MTTSSERSSRPFVFSALFGGACALALALAGCSAGAGPAGSEQGTENSIADVPDKQEVPVSDGGSATHGAAGAATVSVSGRNFDFELSLCTVYDSGDVLLGGLGGELGSNVSSYLDGDATPYGNDVSAEFRLDIGADGPFQSTDTFIALGNSIGGTYALSGSNGDYVITADAWDQSGANLGSGTITFTCD